MGFKRTAEGRVFFSGSGGANDGASQVDASNDESLDYFSEAEEIDMRKSPLSRPSSQAGERSTALAGGQIQVLSLLKSLNEKLQINQLERSTMRQELESYRKLVESLEEKAKATDMAYRELRARVTSDHESVSHAENVAVQAMAEMERTRSMMLKLEGHAEEVDRNMDSLLGQAAMHKQVSVALSKKQVELERKYNEHSERIARGVSKYQELVDRVEGSESKIDQAMEKQERFLQRLEQEAQDRALFMQRFEEKALLDDRTGNKHNDNAAFPKAALLQPHPAQSHESYHNASAGQRFIMFWERPIGLNMPVILSLAVVFALLGWAINSLQQPNWPSAEWFAQEVEETDTQVASEGWQSSTDVEAYSSADSSTDAAAEEANPSFGPSGLDTESTSVPETDQQEDMQSMMEADPDAVAAALNAIEPGNTEAVISDDPVILDGADASEAVTGDAEAAVEVEVAQAEIDFSAPPQVNAELPNAVKEIESMAIEGVAEAQHDLAAIYVTGHGGVTQDYSKAAYWFDKAAEGGVANASYNLGVLYHQGMGVPKDVDMAIKWYKSAAEMGHPEAQYNLGIAYVEGIGVEYDPVAASLHFESAAQNGVTEAAYNLGLIYENGLLGTPRPDEALMWYKIAADAGSAEAQSALQQLADSLNIDMNEINRIVDDVRAKKGDQFMKNAVGQKEGAVAPVQSSVAPVQKVAVQEQQAVVASPVVAAAASVAQPSDEMRGQILVQNIQSFLMDAGLYPGPADGHIGPLTQDAIRSYQSIHKLPVNGEISNDLLLHMRGDV
jgi:TPR repeat protein